MSALTGRHFIAGCAELGDGPPFAAIDPFGGGELAPTYRDATAAQIDRAMAAAAAAAPLLAASAPAQRAALLRRIAAGLIARGDDLVARITAETALPAGRVAGERARTVLQLEQFAALLDDGGWVDAQLERGDPQRQPLPRPDLRRMLVPLGPVAVFGASNFPLAYSVAGGDTASALAAGCPVVVKGHPAHPGTSELVGEVVAAGVQELGLPPGSFALLHGHTAATGAALVQHPALRAVGFTGSLVGGRALFDLAARRPEPIPVFAEMGSANPVVVLPRALGAAPELLAARLAESALLAHGQFCTSPGLILWIDGDGAAALRAGLCQRLGAAAAGPAVHPGIRAGFEQALATVRELPVEVLATGTPAAAAAAVCPTLLAVAADVLLREPRLRSEIYGPAVLTVGCRSAAELLAVVESLGGHLTGTVHAAADDLNRHATIVAALARRVGRLIANGVPTGVEVAAAMVHGGPYPATTDARFSAVGTTSIQRWVRPMCWQDWPHDHLPAELQDHNPLGIRRLVDGRLEPGRG